MRWSLACTVVFGLLSASVGRAATIVASGGVTSNASFGLLNQLNVLLISVNGANNFSIGMQIGAPTPWSAPSCSVPACTFDFNESFSLTFGQSTTPFVLTYGGTTYSSNGNPNYVLTVVMNFVGPVASGSYSCFNFFDCSGSFSQSNAFTMTGSFVLKNGAATLASDTLAGGGGVHFDSGRHLDAGISSVTYGFTNTPEPAPIGLVGIGLLFGRWLANRCCTAIT